MGGLPLHFGLRLPGLAPRIVGRRCGYGSSRQAPAFSRMRPRPARRSQSRAWRCQQDLCRRPDAGQYLNRIRAAYAEFLAQLAGLRPTVRPNTMRGVRDAGLTVELTDHMKRARVPPLSRPRRDDPCLEPGNSDETDDPYRRVWSSSPIPGTRSTSRASTCQPGARPLLSPGSKAPLAQPRPRSVTGSILGM